MKLNPETMHEKSRQEVLDRQFQAQLKPLLQQDIFHDVLQMNLTATHLCVFHQYSLDLPLLTNKDTNCNKKNIPSFWPFSLTSEEVKRRQGSF
jgi:hypothetical protein